MSALTLDEAKTHLNVTESGHDDEIQSIIDAAETAISQRVGALEPVDRTDRVDGGRAVLLLPVAPVLSVTSIFPTAGGDDVLLADVVVDADAGTIEYTSGYNFTSSRYTVNYSVGRLVLPDDLLFAVKELVRHMWRTQRGPTARPGQPVSDQPAPSYLIPYAVAELLEPHRAPRVA